MIQRVLGAQLCQCLALQGSCKFQSRYECLALLYLGLAMDRCRAAVCINHLHTSLSSLELSAVSQRIPEVLFFQH